MNTATLFNAYVGVRNKRQSLNTSIELCDDAPSRALIRRFRRRLRQSATLERAIQARLSSPWTDASRAALQRYQSAHAELTRAADEKSIAHWREECRSYAVDVVNALLMSGEVKP